MNLTPPVTVVDRFVFALEGLYRAVAARSSLSVLAGRGTEVLSGALILLICQRVRRVEERILRMLARFQAGRFRVLTTRRDGDGSGAAVAPGSRAVRARTNLPRRFGWLLPLVPCDAAAFASQLRSLLTEPEMVALLAAVPQAARVLGPVCRMLGITAHLLTPHLEGSTEAGVAREVKARVRKPRVPVDWGRIPLPRGVLAAARRHRLGKV